MKQYKIPQLLGIVVALLALAALSCSGTSGIGFFATETPTPTITFTPSPTFTPTATPTDTPIPSPTLLPVGVQMEDQPDGSTLFIDYDNKYQMTLPKDWVVIPLSSDDLSAILSNLSEKNPSFQNIAETFKQLDPNVIRVIAVNADSKYIVSGFSTNLTVTALEDPVMSSMPLDFVTGAIEESLKQQGSKLLSSSEPVATNPNGVDVGVFDFMQIAPTSTGANIEVRSKVVVFQTEGKIIMVQLATPKQFGEELLPMLDEVSNSIKLLKP